MAQAMFRAGVATSGHRAGRRTRSKASTGFWVPFPKFLPQLLNPYFPSRQQEWDHQVTRALEPVSCASRVITTGEGPARTFTQNKSGELHRDGEDKMGWGDRDRDRDRKKERERYE